MYDEKASQCFFFTEMLRIHREHYEYLCYEAESQQLSPAIYWKQGIYLGNLLKKPLLSRHLSHVLLII